MDLDALLMEIGFASIMALLLAGLIGLALEGGPRNYMYTASTPVSLPKSMEIRDAGPGLSTLAGVLRSLGGPKLNEELWSHMREWSAGDIQVSLYLEWLRNALSPEPWMAFLMAWYQPYQYHWFDNVEVWEAEPPLPGGPVRIGVVRLAFGAALIVTAYPFEGHVDIVVHGTIVDGEGWKKLLARAAMFYTPSDSPGGSDAERRAEILYLLANSSASLRTDWSLWRIHIEGRGSTLYSEGSVIPVSNIYVLLEMPSYTVIGEGTREAEHYFYAAEPLYWLVVGYPALSLALHLAYPENTDPWMLYRRAADLARSIALTGVRHPGGVNRGSYSAPFLVRQAGTGVCNEQSRASMLLASNALGALTAYASLYYRDLGRTWPEHAVSLLIYPSSVSEVRGTVELPVDVDEDGVNDTADVIADTAGLSPREIAERMISIYVAPPLGYTYLDGGSGPTPVSLIPLNTYVGAVQAAEMLPAWLKAPWLEGEAEAMLGFKPLYTNIPRSEVLRGYGEDWIEKWWSMSIALSPSLKVWGLSEQGVPEKIYRDLASRFPGDTGKPASPLLWEKLFEIWVNRATGVEDVSPPSMILALHTVIQHLPVVLSEPTPSLTEVLPRSIMSGGAG